ncbi:unnamed protein product [Fusarium langsethiae]|nr:unnamed protein product [Fusarium langsethiae]
MATEFDAVVQERFVIDESLRKALIEGLDRAGWQKRAENETISTIGDASPALKIAITSLAHALVQAGKIRREEGSGNIVRAEGPSSLTISANTHIVPITFSGSAPTVGSCSLALDTITHVGRGKIQIKPASVVCFSFYSELSTQVKGL